MPIDMTTLENLDLSTAPSTKKKWAVPTIDVIGTDEIQSGANPKATEAASGTPYVS